ncbi:MAG TPA: hypothetical protein VF669_16260 [Tepidisphaeraceae bacterium]|jgi:T5SS/PEP-CTERM-associated repeat protein
MRGKRSAEILFALAAAVSPVAAWGQNWTNLNTGDWFTPSNWSPGTVPSSASGVETVIDNAGTATIAGGNASAVSLTLGDGVEGTVVQSGGTLAIAFAGSGTTSNNLFLGNQLDSFGTYQISGAASKLSVEDAIYVGSNGFGTFKHQSGTVSAGALNIGSNTSINHGGGNYNLTTGTLTVGRVRIGQDWATGSLGQGGGSIVLGGAGITDAFQLGSTSEGMDPHATYNLSAGSLSFSSSATRGAARTLDFGVDGRAGFAQSGGSVDADVVRFASGSESGQTRWEMYGGTLGNSQTVIELGVASGGGAPTAYIDGGTIAVAQVKQNRGTMSFLSGSIAANRIAVGGSTEPQSSSWFMSGGTLTGDIIVGDTSGAGALHVSAGTINARDMVVGNDTRASELDITSSAANITVSGDLVFKPTAVFKAVSGSIIRMTGSNFFNQSSDPSSMLGLNNLKLIFKGGSSVIDQYEVSSPAKGSTDVGFQSTLKVLQLGEGGTVGKVQLVDNFNNIPGAEALYVDQLILGPGSQLNLNGQTVYYKSYINTGGTLQLNGGQMVAYVPEPAGMAVLAVAAGAMMRRRGKKQ